MISKARIKFLNALKQKKFRQKYNKFIVEGHKSCLEFLHSAKYPIDSIYVNSEWYDEHKYLLPANYENISLIDQESMSRITQLKTATPMLLVCDMIPLGVNVELNGPGNVVYLDDIRDPGNMGTIIRICDWFGVKYVVSSPASVDYYNSKVVQATMGSMCGVNLQVMEFGELVEFFPQHKVYVTDMQGTSVRAILPEPNWIVVIGNEGQGIRQEIIDYGHYKLTIPGNKTKVAESLNAAISTGIILAYMSKP